jgi:cephalosporin hydroxylase
MLKYTGSNQRIPEYHAWMLLCLGMGAKTYVELGIGSSWEQSHAGMVVVTVDILPNGFPHPEHIRHFQGDSHDPAIRDQVLAHLQCEPDIVFIDADHSYAGCRADFDLWYPHARMAVAFHDIRLREGCDRVWEEVSQQYPSIEIIGRDHASAVTWQNNAGDAGRLNAGGIGVIFK